MATIEKRVGRHGKTTYRVKVRLKDKGHVSRTFDKMTLARNWAQKTEVDIRERRYFPEAESRRHTLAEAIARYRRDVLPHKAATNQTTEESRLRWWEERLGPLTLDQVTPPVIIACRDELLGEGSGYTDGRLPDGGGPGLSPSTVVRYLRVLSRIFNLIVHEWEWLAESPLSRVPFPRNNPGRVRFLSEEEMTRLLEACRESGNLYLHTAVVVAISTGMRHGELFGLTWSRVDLDRGRCRLESAHTKTRTSRAAYLSGEARRLMTLLYEHRDRRSDLCFPSPINPGKPYDIRRPFTLALRAAGVEDFTWHDLRHTCASYLLMNGATLGEVAEVLGHRTLAMVKRYAHIAESHTASVVERMNKNLFG